MALLIIYYFIFILAGIGFALIIFTFILYFLEIMKGMFNDISKR